MASDYWEQKFREADERAALLAEATVPELVAMYHATGGDIDAGSLCFEALQRRPHQDVRAAALKEMRARTVRRRRFAATLISISAHREDERETGIPLLMGLLDDSSPGVAASAMEALASIQIDASGRDHGHRLRAGVEGVPVEGWPPMQAVVDVRRLSNYAHHRSDRAREALARVCWLCGEPAALELLLLLTRDPDEYVRGCAADGLAHRLIAGGPMTGVRERLREMADHDPTSARFDALAALLELGDSEARGRVARELEAALNAGLRPHDRHQLLFPLYKDPSLVPDEVRERLTKAWCLNFAAPVPSEFAPS